MNRFRPLRRLLASALGILLLQAFLAPGDLACALRHHADGAAAVAAGSAGEPARHPAASHEGHEGHGAGPAVASQGADAPDRAPASGDHCSDPARHHCAWMSACAPVAVMAPAPTPTATRPLAQLGPVPASPRLPATVALLPEVPPPRG